MGSIKKLANAIAIFAVAFSFALYVFAFEPFGVAEFAYVFAVPAILACRFLCGKIDNFSQSQKDKKYLEELERFGLSADKLQAGTQQTCDDISTQNKQRKLWNFSTFVFSYISWIAILVWLRHVYPPSGMIGLFGLTFVISTFFIFPWYWALPKMLPSLKDKQSLRILKLGAIASLWILFEWLRSWVATGFPWGLLAHSQWLRPASIQTASFGGVWIVSFTLIFFNLAIAEYIYRLYEIQKWKIKNNFSRRIPFTCFAPEFYIALTLALTSVWIYIANLPRKENRQYEFTAGFIQTDFAGILKWDNTLARENLKTIRTLTKGLQLAKVDVALWPEAATPPRYPVIGYPEMKNWIESLSKETRTPILMGNMAYNYDDHTAQGGAFFVSHETGLNKEFYAKRRLVPFGEYVPFWCKWLSSVVPIGNMKAGESPVLLNAKIAGKNYKIGSMICYEDIFPYLARENANAGADMLFVCTNDSWYGREGGAWQHASHSAFQAVSTRLPLLRSSNNGLSTVFDQYGRMCPSIDLRDEQGKTWDASTPVPAPTLKISDENGTLIDPQTLSARRSAPLLNDKGTIYFRGAGYADVVYYKNFEKGKTFYVKYGDWFVAFCALIFALDRIVNSRRKKKA